jgi:hypothetical protein
VSLSSFQLKGGGWYADGYAAKPASEAKEGNAGEKASLEKKTPKPNTTESSGS